MNWRSVEFGRPIYSQNLLLSIIDFIILYHFFLQYRSLSYKIMYFCSVVQVYPVVGVYPVVWVYPVGPVVRVYPLVRVYLEI